MTTTTDAALALLLEEARKELFRFYHAEFLASGRDGLSREQKRIEDLMERLEAEIEARQ
jgi:hypothetical protein